MIYTRTWRPQKPFSCILGRSISWCLLVWKFVSSCLATPSRTLYSIDYIPYHPWLNLGQYGEFGNQTVVFIWQFCRGAIRGCRLCPLLSSLRCSFWKGVTFNCKTQNPTLHDVLYLPCTLPHKNSDGAPRLHMWLNSVAYENSLPRKRLAVIQSRLDLVSCASRGRIQDCHWLSYGAGILQTEQTKHEKFC